jgi:anaerobic selenocysteine-containing dehydrogenase
VTGQLGPSSLGTGDRGPEHTRPRWEAFVTRTSVVPSYCRICPALCGVLVELDGDRIVAVRGDRQHTLSQGYTCPKGRALPDEHEAPDRLRGSLRRTADPAGDGFAPVSSDEAIAEIAQRLRAIVDEHGPRAVGLYVGTRGYEVLQLAAATAWLDGIGSPSLYSTYTIDQPGKDLARAIHGSWPAGFHDVSTSDVLMLVGNNPLVSGYSPYVAFPVANPRVALQDAKRRGLSLIVIDPRRTETAAFADLHLQPLPGHDSEILAAMIKVIIAEDRFDHAFVARWATGFDALREAVRPFDPERVAAAARIAAADIVEAARRFATGPRGCAVGGTGPNMSPHPVLAEYLMLGLNTLCGRYRRAGETIPNPGVLSAGRALEAGVRSPRRIWGSGPQPRVRGLSTMYGQMPASALADEILEPGEGRIRALVVSGGNPLVALPDHQRARRALRSLDLLVCLDVRMTQTVRLADYAIGCRLSLEKMDTTLASDLRFPEPFAQWTPAVREPAFDVIEEWEFFWGLARAMGTPWDLQRRIGLPIPIDATGALPEGRKPTALEIWELLCSQAKVPLAEVARHPHGLAPDLAPVIVLPERPDNEDRLQLADTLMLAELAELGGLADTERSADVDRLDGGAGTFEGARPGARYPFLLSSRRMWEFHNSWGHDIARLRGELPASPAFVHPDDLAELGVESGSAVTITSAHGTIETTALAAADVRRGVISMPHCWGSSGTDDDPQITGACTNDLVDATTDLSQIVGMARQSAIPVDVRPATVAHKG